MKCELPFVHFFLPQQFKLWIYYICLLWIFNQRGPCFVCWAGLQARRPITNEFSPFFVLDCQPIRRITAGYECVIIMSLRGRAKLSPSVFWRLPNCCPITPRHLLDQNSVCSAESIQRDAYHNPPASLPLCHDLKQRILYKKKIES